MQWQKNKEELVHEVKMAATLLPDEPVRDRQGREWLPERMWITVRRTGPVEWGVRVRRIVKGGALWESGKTVTSYSGYNWHERTLAAFAKVADELAATAPKDEAHERDEALAKLQKHHDSFVEQIYRYMPECWEGDEDEALRFVASIFEPRGSASPGHSEDCDCF